MSDPTAQPPPEKLAPETLRRPLVSIREIANEFSTGWCMVEVTMNSLNGQEIGHPEGEVLKRALKILWPVAEYLSELEPLARLDGEEADERTVGERRT